MKVETPVMNIAVELREVSSATDDLQLSGVASTMPCTVTVSAGEIRTLVRLVMRPSVLGFVLRALFRPSKQTQ